MEIIQEVDTDRNAAETSPEVASKRESIKNKNHRVRHGGEGEKRKERL